MKPRSPAVPARAVFILTALILLVTTTGPAAAQPVSSPPLPAFPGRIGANTKLYLPMVYRDYPQPLRINLGSYPNIVDPQISSYVNEISVLKLIYEGLTRLDEHLETVPGAAQSWQYNPTATELTFALRTGLQYSDGSLLNAARFAYSIKRNIDPQTEGAYASITDEIDGAPEWRGCTSPASCAAARQTVDQNVRPLHSDGKPCDAAAPYTDAACNTLKLTLSRPAPYFHTVMSLSVVFPAKEELIVGGDEWWRDPARQIGNGPFVMTINTRDVVTRFVPNMHYWRGLGTYKIEYKWIGDSAEAFQAYRNGDLDITALAAADAGTVKNDPLLKSQWLNFPGSCTYAFMMHNQIAPFTDPKVRQAFAYALDRERWVREVMADMGGATLTWIPPGYPGYDATENRWAYNPDLARQALAQSSYGSAGNLPTITATFSDSPRNRMRWDWLIARFREVLGVEIVSNPLPPSQYTGNGYQMYINGWCADYPDPQNWLSVYWKTESGFAERIGYSNPVLDALLDRADVEPNQAVRMQLYAEAQRMLTADLPAAYMWNNVNNFMVKPRVQGVKTTPQDSGWPGSTDPLSISVH